MSPFFIALTLTDVLLLTLLVALPVRVAWWAKLLAIVVVFSFNFLAWDAADSGKGWPVAGAPPADAEFITCVVIEPDISSGQSGVIYVWVVPTVRDHGVLSYRSADFEPRAYAVSPYDRSLHEACETAKKAQKQGVRASIRRQSGRGQRGQGLPSKYIAYVLPSPNLPRKGGR